MGKKQRPISDLLDGVMPHTAEGQGKALIPADKPLEATTGRYSLPSGFCILTMVCCAGTALACVGSWRGHLQVMDSGAGDSEGRALLVQTDTRGNVARVGLLTPVCWLQGARGLRNQRADLQLH